MISPDRCVPSKLSGHAVVMIVTNAIATCMVDRNAEKMWAPKSLFRTMNSISSLSLLEREVDKVTLYDLTVTPITSLPSPFRRRMTNVCKMYC